MFDLNVTTAVVGTSLITTVGSGAAVGVGSGGAVGAGAAVGTGAGVGARGTPAFRWCATYQAPPPTARRTTAARKTFRAEPPSSRALTRPPVPVSVWRRTSPMPPASGREEAGPRGVSRTREDLPPTGVLGDTEAVTGKPDVGVATVFSMSPSGISNAGPSGTFWRSVKHSARSSPHDEKRFARSLSRALRIKASRPRGSAGSSELGGAGDSFMIL